MQIPLFRYPEKPESRGDSDGAGTGGELSPYKEGF